MISSDGMGFVHPHPSNPHDLSLAQAVEEPDKFVARVIMLGRRQHERREVDQILSKVLGPDRDLASLPLDSSQ